MPIEQGRFQCSACDKPTLFQRPKCNHLVHAIVSLFLCGLWIPVWIIAAHKASNGNWRCQTCGWSPDGTKAAAANAKSGGWVIAIVVVVIAMFVVMVLVPMIFGLYHAWKTQTGG